MSKEFDIAKTIYNLNYQKILDHDNYKFDIDKKNRIIKELFFINEKRKISFCTITGKELFNFFY
tara:strand:- start:17 stop:208 length:192 start_codon:yes stop_codon:yes gene_type:complete